jgi:hypothetical protein
MAIFLKIVGAFLLTSLVEYCSASCSRSGSVLTSSSGLITGPSSYQPNDVCTWTLAPTSGNNLEVSLDSQSSLADGDRILIYSCSTMSCFRQVLIGTCSHNTSCSKSLMTTNPILMIRFQGGSSGIRSTFSLSYSSTQSYAGEICPETNCTAHCSLNTASACTSASTCQIRSSDETSKFCSCIWTYRGNSPPGATEANQPDYETNGSCGDLELALSDIVAAILAIGTGILVRPARDTMRARYPT